MYLHGEVETWGKLVVELLWELEVSGDVFEGSLCGLDIIIGGMLKLTCYNEIRKVESHITNIHDKHIMQTIRKIMYYPQNKA